MQLLLISNSELLQVLELMKKCIVAMPYNGKLGEIIRNVMFSDSSIHNRLFQIACTTAHALEVTYVEAFSGLFISHLLTYFAYSYILLTRVLLNRNCM